MTTLPGDATALDCGAKKEVSRKDAKAQGGKRGPGSNQPAVHPKLTDRYSLLRLCAFA